MCCIETANLAGLAVHLESSEQRDRLRHYLQLELRCKVDLHSYSISICTSDIAGKGAIKPMSQKSCVPFLFALAIWGLD